MADIPKLQDKLINSLIDCGWVDSIVRINDIDIEIKELENKARTAKNIENAPRNAPLSNFLSEEDAARLSDLKHQRQLVRDSIDISGRCATEQWEQEARLSGSNNEDLLAALGFRIATVEGVKKFKKESLE